MTTLTLAHCYVLATPVGGLELQSFQRPPNGYVNRPVNSLPAFNPPLTLSREDRKALRDFLNQECLNEE